MKEPPSSISILNTTIEKDKVKNAICDFSDMTDEQIKVIKNRIHVIINTKDVLKVTFSDNESEPTKTLVTV